MERAVAAANLKTGEFMSQSLGKKIQRVLQLIKKNEKNRTIRKFKLSQIQSTLKELV